MKALSQKAQSIPASKIRKIFEMVLSHHDLINFSVGEPDFDTPQNIVEVAVEKLRSGETRYTSSSGLPILKETVSKWMNEKKDIHTEPQQIVITQGAMEALFLCWKVLLNPGDEVIIGAPFFSNYEGQIIGNDGTLVYVPLKEENDFVMDPDDLERAITSKTKAILLNSPSNPLGAVIDRPTLERIADIAKKYDLYVVTDEVYQDFIYEEDVEYTSIAALPDMEERTIVVDSFSKSYAMTGWRIGMLAAPPEIAGLIVKQQESVATCVNTAFQYAAVEALTGSQEEKKKMLEAFKRRRDLLVAGINEIPGFSCKPPKGAFYLFVNIKESGFPSEELSRRLIEEAGVAVVPGNGFSEYGEGYIRMSYVVSEEDIREALKRIKAFMKKVKGTV